MPSFDLYQKTILQEHFDKWWDQLSSIIKQIFEDCIESPSALDGIHDFKNLDTHEGLEHWFIQIFTCKVANLISDARNLYLSECDPHFVPQNDCELYTGRVCIMKKFNLENIEELISILVQKAVKEGKLSPSSDSNQQKNEHCINFN